MKAIAARRAEKAAARLAKTAEFETALIGNQTAWSSNDVEHLAAFLAIMDESIAPGFRTEELFGIGTDEGVTRAVGTLRAAIMQARWR